MHRQTDYKPEYDDMVLKWLADGKTLYAFGQHVGVCTATLYNWRDNNTSFLEAITRGRELTKEWGLEFLNKNLENQKINNGVFNLYCINVLKLKTKDDAPPPPPVDNNANNVALKLIDYLDSVAKK